MWRAIQERFPGFTIQGCIFHWTQAVYRKVQEIGLQRHWIRNPVFPVPNWSVFMLSVRTNNDLEGWHNRLNARVCRIGRVPFYLLLIELYQEATAFPLVARLVSERKLERINRKKTNLLNGKLF
ncbi:uncharacterized protein LOC111107015 [Crassostrea virginica]